MDSMQIQNEPGKAYNIDAILSSLDGIKRAEAPPFLYTRIQARLHSSRRGIFENLRNLISKPVIAISFLFLILFMDIIVYQSALNILPEESETSAEDIFATNDYEEMLFYEVPESDYFQTFVNN